MKRVPTSMFLVILAMATAACSRPGVDGSRATTAPELVGAWRSTLQFRSGALADITGGGGWLPSGRGVFVERIRMSAAGDSFTSTIRYDALDPAGRPIPGGGEAEARAARIGF